MRETRWKDSFAEDSLAGIKNVVSGTGEIGEVANVYWQVQLRLCDGDDGAWRWSVARVGGEGALDGGSDGGLRRVQGRDPCADGGDGQ